MIRWGGEGVEIFERETRVEELAGFGLKGENWERGRAKEGKTE